MCWRRMLRFTKDGEIVLFHDATLERMTGGRARCAIIRWQRSRGYALAAATTKRAATSA